MPDLLQNYGAGAIAIALIVLLSKIWHDTFKQNRELMEIIRGNAVAQEKTAAAGIELARNVSENTVVTRKQSEALKQHTEAMMQLVVRLLRKPNSHIKQPIDDDL